MTNPKPQPAEPSPNRSRLAKWLRWRYVIPLLAILSPLAFLAGYRSYYLAQVPNIPPPFDVEKFGTVEIADEANACPLHERAIAALKPISTTGDDDLSNALDGDWSSATPAVRQWLADNQGALKLFRQASAMPQFLAFHPQEITCLDFALTVGGSRDLIRLTVLQSKRLIAENELEQAWNWLRVVFRFSRQLGQHGLPLDRVVGSAFFHSVTEQTIAWADNPNVTAEQLRNARLEIGLLYRNSVPASEALKVQYLAMERLFQDPELLEEFTDSTDDFSTVSREHLRFVTRVEPQYSQRLVRHVFKNRLPYADLPKHLRPPMIGADCLLFNVTSPTAAAADLPVTQLLTFIDQSTYAKVLLRFGLLKVIDLEQAYQGMLQVILAAQQYRREHGDFPPDSKALIDGGYLDEMPLDSLQSTKAFIQYRNTNDCVTVYSLGDDGIDQGGCEASWDFREGDLGVVLRREEEKRK